MDLDGRDASDRWAALFEALAHRFGESGRASDQSDWMSTGAAPPDLWSRLAGRGSARAFAPEPPPVSELRALAALALCAPTKSDLQQRDIVLVMEPEQLATLKALLVEQDWVADAPAIVVFCANHRRQRLVHEMRGRPFANDHLDAFFNASVDAAIALATFVLAAEAAGYGTCPISAIRNRVEEASAALALPDHVFPVAGLAIGRPATTPAVSLRLPLSATVHENQYRDDAAIETIEAYDRRRAKAQPAPAQRMTDAYGVSETYGWSEDKARQYSRPERADFGAFIRRKGFNLD